MFGTIVISQQQALETQCVHYRDGLMLCYWQGAFCEWKHGAYQMIPDSEIRARVTRVVKHEFDRQNLVDLAEYKPDNDRNDKGPPKVRKVTVTLVSNVLLSLTGYTLLASDTPQPSFLLDAQPYPPEDVLPTKTMLIYLPGFVGGAGDATREPTPLFFCPYTLDYGYDPDW